MRGRGGSDEGESNTHFQDYSPACYRYTIVGLRGEWGGWWALGESNTQLGNWKPE